MNPTLIFIIFAFSPLAQALPTCAPTHRLNVKLERVIQRTALGYTEGLTFDGNTLVESSGFEYHNNVPDDRSTLNQINLETGAVTSVANTPQNNFGEGISYLNHKFYQLTYQDGNLYVYSDQFQLIGTYANPLHEGWGMTNDGKNLIATDGTRTITTIDPNALKTLSTLEIQVPANFDSSIHAEDVSDQRQVTNALQDPKLYSGPNSIDLFQGRYLMNLYQTDEVIEVDPSNGCVVAYASLTPLRAQLTTPENQTIQNDGNYVFNGIIHDPADGSLYVFGKRWPKFFKIKLVD